MINDILFCLLGYTGGVFLDNNSSFVINETITCITKSEKDLLKKIAEIGFKYKILKDFVKNFSEIFSQKLIKNNIEEVNKEEILNSSVYLAPICHSIEEFLKSYEKDIEELETGYINNLSLTGSEIIAKLDHYVLKFDKIYMFLQYICDRNLKGGDFLNYLYEFTINGDPEIRRIFKRFFIHTNKMLLNYITMWIINGSIPNTEFFILTTNNYLIDTDVEYSELKSWNNIYYIEYNNIPFYFPPTLAEDILFVGKALKVLNSNKNAEEDKIPFNEISIFYSSLQKMADIMFNEDEQINIINIELLTKVISLIKACTAKYLWKLVITKRGFLNHLNGVKNIFLTFNGEFYFNFINKIKKLLNMPFDKNVEKEINDVYFFNSMKEIFNIDDDAEAAKIYSHFRIKLISAGFSFKFSENVNSLNEISFLGAISFDLNILRFLNTIYKNQPGAVWNTSQYDLDDEFVMSSSFIIKNFTKQREMNSNTTPLKSYRGDEIIKSSLIKGRKIFENNDQVEIIMQKDEQITISYILHMSKNFKTTFNINDLNHYFQFQFIIKYKGDYKKPNFITFSMRYISKQKKIILNSENMNYKQINDNEIEIFCRNFTQLDTDFEFMKNEKMINFEIAYKDNYCNITSQGFNFGFPFSINQIMPKDKRKMVMGMIITSDNMDIMLDLDSWNFHFYSGEIYNENSNLILISYEPPWPHNFIFNENVIKMYNLIFNLIFPLKTNLTLLNELWIDKKCAKKDSPLFRLIDTIHAEFVTFLQNLISFFMFDIIDLKYKIFHNKLKDCQDFEQIIKHHEEFLFEVITNSFVKSKKIMRIIFDILFTTRKFYNIVENILSNAEEENEVRDILLGVKEEFYNKKNNLISVFQKIKNTKYFAVISQLLTKIDYES
jgi:hypothetical protein